MDQVSFYKMFSINNFQQDQFPIEIQRNFFSQLFLRKSELFCRGQSDIFRKFKSSIRKFFMLLSLFSGHRQEILIIANSKLTMFRN